MLERHCQATLVIRSFALGDCAKCTDFKLINDHHDGLSGQLQAPTSSDTSPPAEEQSKHLQLHALAT